MNIVITGTAQGIGLELTKIALSHKHSVLAVARSQSNAKELEALAAANSHLKICYLDLTIPDAPAKLAQAAAQFPQVDILINNAGIYRDGETRQDFEESFLVNSIIPFLVTKALFPLLKKSATPKAPGRDRIHREQLSGPGCKDDICGFENHETLRSRSISILGGLIGSSEESWVIGTILPSRFGVTNMPQPLEKNIKLVKIPGMMVASCRYSGKNSEELMDRKTLELMDWLEKQSRYKSVSEARFAQYDSPYSIPLLRRNEIQITVVETEMPQKKFQ